MPKKPKKPQKRRRKPVTPRSRLKSVIRGQIWLKSRERALRLKLDGSTCQHCKRKASKAKGKEFKVEVHHREGVLNWDKIYEALYEYLLVGPDKLETLCKKCHKRLHEEGK